MPDKEKRKKPRHTKLVVPGDHRQRRSVDEVWEPEEAASAFGAAPGEGGPEDGLPPNAIRLPRDRGTRRRKSTVRSPVRKRRRRRRLVMLVALLLAVAVFVVFQTSVYLMLGSMAGDLADSLRIAVQPGDGFPMSLAVTGYLRAEPMGKNGFAVLGERDFIMVSASGGKLRQVQHIYATPAFSVGEGGRAVLYNRGGQEYTVESRSKTLARHTTDQDILFAQMSPGGWLAVATISRFRATLEVYDPTYDTGSPALTLPLVDAKPVLVAFQPSNRGLALGCLSTSGGAMTSTITLLRTDRSEVQGTITEVGATLLKAEYHSDGKVLAIYDSFAAIYDSQGRAVVRYDYDGRQLLACDMADGMVGLVFGSAAQQTLYAVLLDGQLNALLGMTAPAATAPQVLATADGLFLLAGRELLAQSVDGVADNLHYEDAQPLGLVHAPAPLVLVPGEARPLEEMLLPQEARQEQASVPAASSGAETENGTATGNSAGNPPDNSGDSGGTSAGSAVPDPG